MDLDTVSAMPHSYIWCGHIATSGVDSVPHHKGRNPEGQASV